MKPHPQEQGPNDRNKPKSFLKRFEIGTAGHIEQDPNPVYSGKHYAAQHRIVSQAVTICFHADTKRQNNNADYARYEGRVFCIVPLCSFKSPVQAFKYHTNLIKSCANSSIFHVRMVVVIARAQGSGFQVGGGDFLRFFFYDEYRGFLGANAFAPVQGIHFGEFGSEIKDQGIVIHPG